MAGQTHRKKGGRHMDFKSMAGTAVSQISGNIEKAIIEIIDMRGRTPVVQPPVPVQGEGGVGGLMGGGLTSTNFMDVSQTFAGAAGITDTVSNLAENAGLDVRNLSSGMLGFTAGATRKLFHVQFNPSELSLSGYGGGLTQKTDFSEGANGISFEKADVHISLNVKLIFDKVDPQDAFMGDKLNTSPMAIGTGIAKGVLTHKGKKENSVQTEVEGFIAALRSKYTRRITFHWGTMNYTGILNRISSQYTMFNVLGEPVRAYVSLSLVCADEKISPKSMGIWQKYYEQLFEIGDQSFVGMAQKAGNLLNFNL